MDDFKGHVIETTTAQIGRCGEILVQYRLLKMGIESAPMTTDTGVDLVAYSPGLKRAVTIQVKTNLKPKPGGGRGMLALDWWVPEDSPAEWVALVDLEADNVWLFSQEEVVRLAQQQSSGRLHFYFYTGPDARPRQRGRLAADYDTYKLERRVNAVFGINPGSNAELRQAEIDQSNATTVRTV